MKVCWVISEDIPKGFIDPKIIKDTAPAWGSWKTWKEYKIDNCVCTSTSEVKSLIGRAFHAVCNFYILQESYIKVGSPVGVKLFNGQFKGSHIANKDDLVTLNLVAAYNDIVLMSGFNFSPILNTDDGATQTARKEYYFNIRELMKTHNSTQFVLVDYVYELASWAKELDNLTMDTIDSVRSLLS